MPYKVKPVGLCAAPGCGIKTLTCKGMCNTHYQRFRKHGRFELIHPKLGRPVAPGKRFCPDCEQELDKSDFRLRGAYYCKRCESAYFAKRKADKIGRGECISCGRTAMEGKQQCYECTRRGMYYRSRFERRAKSLLASMQVRSLEQGVKCTLNLEWILTKIKGRCELSGLPFDLESKKGVFKQKFNPYAPSVDRIKWGDYSPENCRMILIALNIGINHWGEDIYRLIAKAYLRNRKEKRNAKESPLTSNLDLPLEGQPAPSLRIRRH